MPINADLLEILVCPACRTQVQLVKGSWLVCPNSECRRKYPIVADIPVLLIEEGDKHVDTAADDLDITNIKWDEVGTPAKK